MCFYQFMRFYLVLFYRSALSSTTSKQTSHGLWVKSFFLGHPAQIVFFIFPWWGPVETALSLRCGEQKNRKIPTVTRPTTARYTVRSGNVHGLSAWRYYRAGRAAVCAQNRVMERWDFSEVRDNKQRKCLERQHFRVFVTCET